MTLTTEAGPVAGPEIGSSKHAELVTTALITGTGSEIRDLLLPLGPTVGITEQVDVALGLLREAGVDYLAVTDTSGAPVGLITRGDIAELQRAHPGNWSSTRCEDVIDVPARYLHPEESFDVAVEMLSNHGVRPLLIFEKGKIVGILEPTAVFQWCAQHRPTVLEELAFLAGTADLADGLRPFGERYHVSGLLGRGGMADVHLARDVALNRMVAIKTPRLDRIGEPGLVERFRQEARSVAGLEHPSIVSVLSTGEDFVTDSRDKPVRRPYIVMEHVDGVTLRTRARARAATDREEALRIVDGVLSALGYAHNQGVVHGDLTATNVMVAADGEVKLIDFGSSSPVVTDPEATRPLAADATPHYVSPERVQGLLFDTRADLYSTGCILYELLTGRTPFAGASAVDLAYQHVHHAPEPPSRHSPHVGARLDAVVLRALAKEPEERYQGAQEFRRDLLAARSGWSRSDVEPGAP